MYPRILREIKESAQVLLLVKTFSIPETFKKFNKMPDEEIKQALEARGKDVSLGSTYLINLNTNQSYRFRDHKRFMAVSEFRGFFKYHTELKLREDIGFEDLKKMAQNFAIREGRGEIHDSTPIKSIAIVPSVVLTKALKDKNIEGALGLWNSFFK